MNKLIKTIFFLYLPLTFIYIASAGYLFDKKSYASYIVGGLIFLYAFFSSIKLRSSNKYFYAIIVFMIYVLILVLYSSDLLYSLKLYIQSVIPLLFLFLSYKVIRSINDLRGLNNSILVLMVMYLVNLLIANSLDLGGASYEEDVILDTGNVFTAGLNSMAYALVLLPLILYFNKNKLRNIIYIIIGAIVLVTVVVTLKRISIISVLLGYSILFLLLRVKGGFLKYIIFTLLIALSAYPLYFEFLQRQLITREDRLRVDSYETEGRYQETLIVFEEVFSFDEPMNSWFGKEMFNSAGNYGGGMFGDRMLHSDYNVLLHGSGIIGLSLFLFMQFNIYRFFLKTRRINNKIMPKGQFMILSASFNAVFIILFIISISGGIHGFIYNSIRYMYIGGILGLFEQTSMNYTHLIRSKPSSINSLEQ